MFGGAYLRFEGAEKVWDKIARPRRARGGACAPGESAPSRRSRWPGAIRTDFILSAEIMVIALKEVVGPGQHLARAVVLVVVAVAHHRARSTAWSR